MTGKAKEKEDDEWQHLDKGICKQLSSLVELLTTSGRPILNPEVMKTFKKLCRSSDEYVKYCYTLLMTQLSKNHSEIRLSAFQMIDEIFNRSHAFRQLLIADFTQFLELAVGVKKSSLPLPKAAANTLKSEACRAIQTWNDKFGEAYKQLALGYSFLQTCEKVDFSRIIAEQEAERRRKEEEERRIAEKKQKKLQEALGEFEDSLEEIRLCVTEMENGLHLLMPLPEDFFIPTHDPTSELSFKDIAATSQCKNSIKSSNKPCENSQTDTASSDINKTADNYGVDANVRSLSACSSTNSANKINPFDQSSKDVENSSLHSGVKASNMDKNEESDEDEFIEEYVNADDLAEASTSHSLSQEVGMFSRQFEITISVGGSESRFVETEDNAAVAQAVRDHYRLVKSRFLPQLKQCLQVLESSGATHEQQHEVVQIQEQLEHVLKKCLELEVISQDSQHASDTDSDDFEEVPEKEGYEDDVPEHVKIQAACSSSSKGKKGKRKSKKSKKSSKEKHPKMKNTRNDSNLALRTKVHSEQAIHGNHSAAGPSLVSVKSEPADADLSNPLPSSAGASLVSVKQEPATEEAKEWKSAEERKQALLKQAPVVPFGLDLKHWENRDQLTAPDRVSYADASRFWVPSRVDGEEAGGSQEEVAALVRRTMTYAGKFEPVKWKCRAPLGDGRLCERMDRVKCPFHGKIIGRDSLGTPTDPTELIRLAHQDLREESSSSESSDDSDQGSVDRKKSKGKGKGKKAKKRKYPNLTDIRQVETSRDRLEAKIFNKSTLKRVCASLDAMDQKKVSAKFANQFNYCLK